jgi:hypothetical protein
MGVETEETAMEMAAESSTPSPEETVKGTILKEDLEDARNSTPATKACKASEGFEAWKDSLEKK